MKTPTLSYITGFVLSLILTIGAYFLVASQTVSDNLLIVFILVLAIIQLIVQLFFFLDLGRDPKSRLNLTFFIITLSIVLLIVVGSIWIINHLNYNMTPKQMNQYVQSQDGF